MEFQALLQKRKSIREYAKKPVENEKLESILQAAFSAPSAGNLQSYIILAVKDAKLKQEIYKAAYKQEFILEVPVVLVFIADTKRSSAKYGERGKELYAVQDATIAAAYAQLEAANLGLGTVWVGGFEPKKISAILKLKNGEVPAAIIPVGYPAEPGHPRQRRKRGDMITEL